MPGRTVEASGHSECCLVHVLIRRSSRRPGHPLHPQPNPPDKYRFSCFDDGRQGVHPGHGEAGLLAQRSGKTAPVWQWIGLADTSSGVWEPPLKPPETTARSTSNWLVMALAAHEVPAGRVRSWEGGSSPALMRWRRLYTVVSVVGRWYAAVAPSIATQTATGSDTRTRQRRTWGCAGAARTRSITTVDVWGVGGRMCSG
jgi:hypothetical protein